MPSSTRPIGWLYVSFSSVSFSSSFLFLSSVSMKHTNLIPDSPFLMPYPHQPPSIFPNKIVWKGYQVKLKTPIPKQICLEIHPGVEYERKS